MTRLAAPMLLATLAFASQAAAHAILVDSFPAPLGHVPAGHVSLKFRYNSRIDAGRSKLTLKKAGDDSGQRLTVVPADKPDLLLADLDLRPGSYSVSWQVLATDGHITRGQVPFIVDPAPGPTAQR
jgi:methionine-rich copper-binding protein CopC